MTVNLIHDTTTKGLAGAERIQCGDVGQRDDLGLGWDGLGQRAISS